MVRVSLLFRITVLLLLAVVACETASSMQTEALDARRLDESEFHRLLDAFAADLPDTVDVTVYRETQRPARPSHVVKREVSKAVMEWQKITGMPEAARAANLEMNVAVAENKEQKPEVTLERIRIKGNSKRRDWVSTVHLVDVLPSSEFLFTQIIPGDSAKGDDRSFEYHHQLKQVKSTKINRSDAIANPYGELMGADDRIKAAVLRGLIDSGKANKSRPPTWKESLSLLDTDKVKRMLNGKGDVEIRVFELNSGPEPRTRFVILAPAKRMRLAEMTVANEDFNRVYHQEIYDSTGMPWVSIKADTFDKSGIPYGKTWRTRLASGGDEVVRAAVTKINTEFDEDASIFQLEVPEGYTVSEFDENGTQTNLPALPRPPEVIKHDGNTLRWLLILLNVVGVMFLMFFVTKKRTHRDTGPK